jgi:hypothetical protein
MTDINRIPGSANRVQIGQTNAGQSKSAANIARKKQIEDIWKSATDAVVKGEPQSGQKNDIKSFKSDIAGKPDHEFTYKTFIKNGTSFTPIVLQGGFAAPLTAALMARAHILSSSASLQSKAPGKPVFGAPQSAAGLTDEGLANLRSYVDGGASLTSAL